MNKDLYEFHGNNGLFIVPSSGPQMGEIIRVGSAPNETEFTGPALSNDGKTLFLSVQHLGEKTKSLDSPTSHWPDGGNSIPRPGFIQISGPTLESIVG